MSDKRITDLLPATEILAQLAEEFSEGAQAALKLRRALDGVNPTPKTVPECWENFVEEYADVFLCIHALLESLDISLDDFTDKASDIVCQKQDRWLKRLQERENKNGKPE